MMDSGLRFWDLRDAQKDGGAGRRDGVEHAKIPMTGLQGEEVSKRAAASGNERLEGAFQASGENFPRRTVRKFPIHGKHHPKSVDTRGDDKR